MRKLKKSAALLLMVSMILTCIPIVALASPMEGNQNSKLPEFSTYMEENGQLGFINYRGKITDICIEGVDDCNPNILKARYRNNCLEGGMFDIERTDCSDCDFLIFDKNSGYSKLLYDCKYLKETNILEKYKAIGELYTKGQNKNNSYKKGGIAFKCIEGDNYELKEGDLVLVGFGKHDMTTFLYEVGKGYVKEYEINGNPEVDIYLMNKVLLGLN